MSSKLKTIWESKEVRRENGTSKRMMICQNSNLELSKWSDFAPEYGACREWVEVVHETTAVLCSNCTSRSINY